MPELGFTREPVTPPSDPEDQKPETIYPSLSLGDENVEKVKGEHDCKVGEEYYAEVRLRVKSISDDEMGQRISFDVLSLDNFEPEDGGDGDEPAGDSGGGDGEKFVGKKTMPKALRYS